MHFGQLPSWAWTLGEGGCRHFGQLPSNCCLLLGRRSSATRYMQQRCCSGRHRHGCSRSCCTPSVPHGEVMMAATMAAVPAAAAARTSAGAAANKAATSAPTEAIIATLSSIKPRPHKPSATRYGRSPPSKFSPALIGSHIGFAPLKALCQP